MRKTFFVIVLVLSAFAARPASAAVENNAYPKSMPWHAKWIWCDGCDPAPHNFYVYMRKEFELPRDPVSGIVRVTADSRYTLYINGARVGRGPVKSDRNNLYYDPWDISRFLKPGKNVIAAIVHQYGEWTFSYMLNRGGFLLEAELTTDDGRTHSIVSDSTWKALPAEAWERNLVRMSVQQGYNEIFDARKAPAPTWNFPGFDDSAWKPAVEAGAPGSAPWPRMHARETAPNFEEIFRPKQIVARGETPPSTPLQGVDFQQLFGLRKTNSAYAATFMYVPKETNIKFTLMTRNACKLWVDKKAIATNYISPGVGYYDRVDGNLNLPAGWTPFLVKCVQDFGDWVFELAADAADSSVLSFSATQDKNKPGWAAIGPFAKSDKPDVFTEIKASYPPQKEIDFNQSYKSFGGMKAEWKNVSDTDRSKFRLARELSRIKMNEAKSVSIGNLDALTDKAGDMAREQGATVKTGEGRAAYFILDFGWEVSGYPRIEVESKNGGESIDLCYAEVLEDEGGNALSPLKPSGRVNCARNDVNYADRYITRPGYQSWEAFDKRAFRFMLVVVRNAVDPVSIRFAGLRFSTYNVGERGSFDSSSELLNRIWKVGAYTLQLNMDDSYTDCPWRERGEWWGDARIEILVNYYAFGDAALARRGILQIGESQRDDGLVAGIYPTDWDNRWLPDYALIWIMSAMDYYRFTGDASLLPELLPRYKKLLDGFFLSHENSDGLLENVPHWVFIDWAAINKHGANTALNLFYYRGLLDAAAQFRTTGQNEDAEKYEARAKRLKDAINRFMWDEQRGMYADCFWEGKICNTSSEQANSLAVSFDVAPKAKQKAIMTKALDSATDIVRSGSPYFSFYILEALRHSGNDAAAMAYINRWGEMLKWGATTWWETWQRTSSHCHAWSSAPTYDLSRNILGVWPDEPGFAKVSIEPRPGDVSNISGIVPTPRGDIFVSWFKKNNPDSFELSFEAPKDVPVTVWIPEGKYDFSQAQVDGTQKFPRSVNIILRKEDGKHGVVIFNGGSHKITVPPIK